jgi:F0F1-type ATP synthase assembly protein I
MGAAICAFPVGMLTVDAFAFTQMTFVLFIVLGLAAAELNIRRSVAPIEDLDRMGVRPGGTPARRAALERRA